MSRARWLASLIALALPLACVISRAQIDPTQLSWLRTNETSKAQVVEMLGTPWRVAVDEENHSWTYEYRILSPHRVGSLVLHFAPEGTLMDYTLNTPLEDETRPLDSSLAH